MGTAYPAEIRALTSLRFFAALFVVFLHFEVYAAGSHWLDGFNRFVDFFFLLSGFVLMHASMAGLGKGTFSYKKFVIRRLARVYPMHLVTLLFFILLVQAATLMGQTPDEPERFQSSLIPAQLLLLQAWGPRDYAAFNYPSWSISSEWFAYLLFPLYAWVTLTLGRVPLVIASALLMVAMYFAAPAITGYAFKDMHGNFGIYRIFPEFMLGCALYRIGSETRIPAMGRPPVFWALAAATFLVTLFQAHFLVSILGFALVILSAAECERAGASVLSRQWSVYLGEVSFSVYMVHVPVATVLFRATDSVLGTGHLWLVLPATAIVIAVSIFTYEKIEKPAREAIIRGSGRMMGAR